MAKQTFSRKIEGTIKEVDGRAPIPSPENSGPFPENVVVETPGGDWTLSAMDLPIEFDVLKKNVGKKVSIEWTVELGE